MSPRKDQESEPEAPSHLKFVGRSDYFVSGVPQSNLVVADVSEYDAAGLIATGLYVPMTAEEYEAEKSAQAAAEENSDG